MDPGPGNTLLEINRRLDAARREFDTQACRYEAAMAKLRATIDEVRRGRSRRQILHASAYARLQARLDTMPVIEQAKGIVMAGRHCGPEEAFDLLRRASQCANVKVSVLAARLVERVGTAPSDTGEEPSVTGGAIAPPRGSPRR